MSTNQSRLQSPTFQQALVLWAPLPGALHLFLWPRNRRLSGRQRVNHNNIVYQYRSHTNALVLYQHTIQIQSCIVDQSQESVSKPYLFFELADPPLQQRLLRLVLLDPGACRVRVFNLKPTALKSPYFQDGTTFKKSKH